MPLDSSFENSSQHCYFLLRDEFRGSICSSMKKKKKKTVERIFFSLSSCFKMKCCFIIKVRSLKKQEMKILKIHAELIWLGVCEMSTQISHWLSSIHCLQVIALLSSRRKETFVCQHPLS